MTAASPLFLALFVGMAGFVVGVFLGRARQAPRERKPTSLPETWPISPRLVFNAAERRLYRQLKEAFPQHVVMPKLSLVRLCQPDELEKVQYWYSLLGSTYVTFTICSPAGKALLAIDLEGRQSRSKRNLEIKEAVLSACKVRYFSMAADGVPTVEALRLLLPQAGTEATADSFVAATRSLMAGSDPIAIPTAHRPTSDTGRWHDSSVFTMDSFFAPDHRSDTDADADSSPAPATSDGERQVPARGVVIDDDAPAPTHETSAARVANR